MTAFLRLNGIEVPVVHDGAALPAPIYIGNEARAIDGSPLINRRVTKQPWGFSTPWLSAAEALAFHELITGSGQVLSFERNSLYTVKGLPPTSADAGFTVSSSNPAFGTYRGANTSSNVATWTVFSASSPWSVALRRTTDGGSTWTHYLVRSDGGKWVDGVRNDGASTVFFGVSAGVLTLGDATAAGWDDVVCLPFVVPDDWPAQMAAFTSAFSGPVPRALGADGLLIKQNTATQVLGTMTGGAVTQGAVAGAWHGNLHSLSFELQEV